MAKKEAPGEKKEPPKEGKESAGKVRFGLRLKFTLAISLLVFIIISSFTAFLIWREMGVLRTQIMQSMEREVLHLANTAQQTMGAGEFSDILTLTSTVNDLKTIKDESGIPYVMYAYVLNDSEAVEAGFVQKGSVQQGEKLQDGIKRSLSGRSDAGKTLVSRYTDRGETGGNIYDFSRIVMSKTGDRKMGYVIIGLSDLVIREEIKRLMMNLSLIFLAFLGISVLGAVVLAGIIIKPIRVISHGAEIIGAGNLDHMIELRSSDELGNLAAEFNRMTAEIKAAKKKEIESRIMEEQIFLAKEIQEGLNPMGFYDKRGIQIKGFTRAAKGVGGDYFDYVDISESKVGALISDVSGKGVPASLVMVMIRTVFNTLKSDPKINCKKVVKAINDSLSADFAIDKFATLFFMIYDRDTEELYFSNAGHGPLFCYRASRDRCTLTKVEGMPIGVDDSSEYEQGMVKLAPGDIVILNTDGVTEMRNETRDEYGIKRLQHFMIRHKDLSPDRFVDLLVKDLDEFKGAAPQHDDTTMLVFKRVS